MLIIETRESPESTKKLPLKMFQNLLKENFSFSIFEFAVFCHWCSFYHPSKATYTFSCMCGRLEMDCSCGFHQSVAVSL